MHPALGRVGYCWEHHPPLYITRTRQGRPAGHGTRGDRNKSAAKPDGNLEKASEMNLEDLHFIFSVQDMAIFLFVPYFLPTSAKKGATVTHHWVLSSSPWHVPNPARCEPILHVRLWHQNSNKSHLHASRYIYIFICLSGKKIQMY